MHNLQKKRKREPVKKMGKRRKQIARKGLHTAKDEAEKDEATVKSPSIASYKIIKQGKKGVYQIVRENGTDKVYMSLGAMLKEISREDLTELYRIVMKRYGIEGPTDDYERVFWENLKIMFDAPLSTDLVWSLPERKYPLSANVCQTMLKMKLLDGKMNEDCYKLLKMIEKQAGLAIGLQKANQIQDLGPTTSMRKHVSSLENGLPKMRGTLSSSSIYKITKSAGNMNFPTWTSKFFAIPIGYWLMLAPRSAKARYLTEPATVHRITQFRTSDSPIRGVGIDQTKEDETLHFLVRESKRGVKDKCVLLERESETRNEHPPTPHGET
ncbi:hypothetical protein Tco_0567256 [Tanacetum coccineum]